ncbi:hypothetical protein [Kribbia dieselivorans]|uniref:hypothetical protein n=1 Tax=Kribbia dieselivorans TaxID=331526 RepID=UPI000837E94A|nr:hypothetical protein [Kribbia dieselivorans]
MAAVVLVSAVFGALQQRASNATQAQSSAQSHAVPMTRTSVSGPAIGYPPGTLEITEAGCPFITVTNGDSALPPGQYILVFPSTSQMRIRQASDGSWSISAPDGAPWASTGDHITIDATPPPTWSHYDLPPACDALTTQVPNAQAAYVREPETASGAEDREGPAPQTATDFSIRALPNVTAKHASTGAPVEAATMEITDNGCVVAITTGGRRLLVGTDSSASLAARPDINGEWAVIDQNGRRAGAAGEHIQVTALDADGTSGLSKSTAETCRGVPHDGDGLGALWAPVD